MNWAVYLERYDVRSIADAVIKGDGSFHEVLEFGNYFTPFGLDISGL